jgi:glyoxylase-like metal-dependent hydrolase (beta-lactamase superfamily II)
MIEVAPGLWQLSGFPPQAVNVYLAGDVLIDTATRWGKWRLVRQLHGHRLSLVALTHCHPDHQGTASYLCRRFGIPLACHQADVPVMEGRAPMIPRSRIVRLGDWLLSGRPHRVDRVLHDGDEVAGFRVVHTPGHTPGHIIFFRESDRVAVAGDVLANLNFLTWRPGLRQPPGFFSVDPALNHDSILKLWKLRPSLICFGHGPPLRRMEVFDRFVQG